MFDQHQHKQASSTFERSKVSVHAESAREVRRLSRLISSWVGEQNSSLLHDTPSADRRRATKTYDFGNGLSLTTSLLISYSIEPATPMVVDHEGTVCNATFTLYYQVEDAG